MSRPSRSYETAFPLQRVLGRGDVHLVLPCPRRLDRALQALQRGARVAARPMSRAARKASPAASGGSAIPCCGSASARSSSAATSSAELVQLVDLAAREQRGVDLEVGVLGGRADQRHGPLLHRGRSVLLRLVKLGGSRPGNRTVRRPFARRRSRRARSPRGPRPCRRSAPVPPRTPRRTTRR